MSLSDLTLAVSPHSKLPKGVTAKKFEEAHRHVRDIFFNHLPDDFTLDGTGSIEIRMGVKGPKDDTRYIRGKGKTASVCYAEGFDFGAWNKASAKKKDELVLEAMVNMIDRIAHAFRSDRNAVKLASKKTLDSDFTGKVHEPDLCESVKARDVEVKVFREVSRKGEMWGLEITTPRSKVLHSAVLEKKATSYDAARKKFAKSKLNGSEFVILSSTGKASFKLSLDQALGPA